MLFGFLLAMPFSQQFDSLDVDQRHLYLADLVLAAVATALLCAPGAYHGLAFRNHEKARILRAANVMAIAGLALVGCAVWGAVILVVSVVEPGGAVALVGVFTFVVFFGLWFLLPISSRRGRDDY